MTKKGGTHRGIGILVRVAKSTDQIFGLRLITIFDDSPAKKAGLKGRDIMTHVNGVKIVNETIDKAMNLLGGPEAKEVEVAIDRSGNEYTYRIEKQDDEIENISESEALDATQKLLESTSERTRSEARIRFVYVSTHCFATDGLY